jgi:hypothetical protein
VRTRTPRRRRGVALRAASRITFTPRRNEISEEIDGYEFEATTRFDQLFTGIAMERPKNLDPNDLTGTEDIGSEDTVEADCGGLLERAYERNHAEGSTSPTGNPDLCSPFDVWFPPHGLERRCYPDGLCQSRRIEHGYGFG